MIRGPVLPQSREALWSLVVGRMESVERGLTLVAEGFDCSGGQLGLVDGLARDAMGAPVLVLLAAEGDPLLVARAIAAAAFLERVGDALAAAVPEAAFCPGTAGRVMVIAVERCSGVFEAFAHQPIVGVQVCRLEPFRMGGAERFAVRWVTTAAGAAPGVAVPTGPAAASPAPAFALPPHLQLLWDRLEQTCMRIDGGMRIDGDRYRRRITWNGKLLAEVGFAADSLLGSIVGGAPRALATPADVREFSDRLLRAFLRLAGSPVVRVDEPGEAPAVDREAASRHAATGSGALSRHAGDSLRSAVLAARLTPDEYSALGGPTSAVGGDTDGAVTADDVARIVAAQESAWPQPGRPD